MVRLNLLTILLFFVLQSSMLCTTRAAATYHPIIYDNSIAQQERPCQKYNKCRTGIVQESGSSMLQAEPSLRYGSNLTSEGDIFRVGFFVLGDNTYLGTWYTLSEKVIVWVANRDKPIPSRLRHNCSLVLGKDGNAAIVLDSNNHHSYYWSTQYPPTLNPSNPSNTTYLQILDNGNLVLIDRISRGSYLWQSFDHPTDTFLPGMDISVAGLNLTSWKTPEDPSKGDYLLQKKDAEISNELIMSCSSQPYYWDSTFSYLHQYLTPLLFNKMTTLLPNNMTTDIPSYLRLVMNATGRVQLWEIDFDEEKGEEYWKMLWMAPKDECDLSDTCGVFGVCDAGNGFKCKCLPGYQPNDQVKWESKDFSSGCIKKTNDQCGQIFLTLNNIKLPPIPYVLLEPSNETECRRQCLTPCGRTAYSFNAAQSKCMIWTSELNHIQEEYYHDAAHTLNIRLNHLDIDSGSRTCSICGTNVIPYPLSINSSCGDPAYLYFECNMTNGQVYFKPPSGRAYKVSLINPNKRMFTIQLAPLLTNKCDSTHDIESKELDLKYNSSPFKVTNCSIVPLMERPSVVEAEVSWINPPLPPACNISTDCKDWPETSCGLEKHVGKKVCLCGNGTRWDSLYMNCTKGDKKHTPLWIKVGIASGSLLFLLSGISFVVLLLQRRVTNRADIGTLAQFKTDDIDDIDIPFVDYQSIVAATDNFSDANKLGVGGFGPVYKGMLVDGKQVAVKRLSAASVQGVQEFRNEIILIAKLQHRNLVRVLGYCISEEEKILIYEYMPNKSLDSFLFDQTFSPSLDWTKRFNIVLGIARGLLYIHQDSRLRIIHRDLKPSNILLDEELNPKISDFGLAKIIAGNDMGTNTVRVVGTYGYMSPEYALEGYFSIKSDVYSFGIIVFEVISGKRCTSVLPLENNLISLLGYTWDLWKQGKELELVDKSIIDTCDDFDQVKRFINVALLCVQEDPSDRPTMSSALLMLGGDTMNLPYPKQPVFVARRQPASSTASSSSKFGNSTCSNVELTNTLEGR